MTETLPTTERETTAAARRRVAAADRARDWRERQREAEVARIAELDALRAEVATLRAERKAVENETATVRSELYAARAESERLRAHFDKLARADTVDEDLARAIVRLGGLRRTETGPLAIGRPEVAVRDVVAAAALIRCGGATAGQEAYDAARSRVFQRLAMLVPSFYDA
ncbi:hypothetical protein [Methylobacterium aquaticum]|uniref:Uncharacterized protein n=1 Tax=Methylobacterium aquaticum TaxID=270351 RepID=A0A0C6FM21_9HYPH|nr:hypothetical protein [Methylobacterium aquaticum]BAQ49433.1 hypothetical protein Maq22A_1p36085 [Methylobacterium aquaticum]